MYLEIKSVKDGIKEHIKNAKKMKQFWKNLLYLIIIKIMKYLYFTFLNL